MTVVCYIAFVRLRIQAFVRVCLFALYACAFLLIMQPAFDAVFGGWESDVLGLVTDNCRMISTSSASVV